MSLSPKADALIVELLASHEDFVDELSRDVTSKARITECREEFKRDREALESYVAALEAENAALRGALTRLLDRYMRLVESGDAGFWDAETEPPVIAARAALATPAGGQAE